MNPSNSLTSKPEFTEDDSFRHLYVGGELVCRPCLFYVNLKGCIQYPDKDWYINISQIIITSINDQNYFPNSLPQCRLSAVSDDPLSSSI